jgi:hypothetical protein
MGRLHGTWQAEGGRAGCGPAVVAVVLALLAAASGAAAAIEAAAMIILYAVSAAAILVVAGLAAAVVLLRRHSHRGAEQLVMQGAALRAEVEGRPDAALPPPSAVHYHIHLAPGMDAAGVIAALPQQRDAITTEREAS